MASMRGSEWARTLPEDPEARDEAVVEAVRAGMAVYERAWLHCEDGKGNAVRVAVTADSMRIGVPEDSVRVPMSARCALRVARLLGLHLPTSLVCDEAFLQADVRLDFIARPWWQDGTMALTRRCLEQHYAVEALVAGRRGLVSSVGKDWIDTDQLLNLPTTAAANYGGHGAAFPGRGPHGAHVAQPIGKKHNDRHSDYSQFQRFVYDEAFAFAGIEPVGPMTWDEVLRHPVFHACVTYEGPRRVTVVKNLSALSAPLPAPGPRTLRIGMSGPDVRAWQAAIGVMADGVFGPATAAATKLWQDEHGLFPDGIVGPATRAALLHGAPAPSGTKGDTGRPQYRFVQARNYRVANRQRADIRNIYLHTAEVSEVPTAAEAVAEYGRTTDRQASWHYVVDCDSTIQCVLDKDVAWAAPDANRDGLHIELCGYARQSDEDWADAYSLAVLDRAAALVAEKLRECPHLSIRFVEAPELRLRKPGGISTHHEATLAWPVGADGSKRTHYDPGPHFPMAKFLDMVRAHAS